MNAVGADRSVWDEEKIGDPAQATQKQIQSRLGRLFPYTRAVSFAVPGQ